jgi:hypothetical protein
MRRQATVTTPGWSVSVCTGSHFAGAVLNVRRIDEPKTRKGDHDGRRFPTSDLAWAFALDHGYIEVYRKGFCPLCRIQHWFCGSRIASCATAGGYPYEGCQDAQKAFDATRSRLIVSYGRATV